MDLFETQSAQAAGYAQVALERGIDTSPTGLTYSIPPALAGLRVGERVTVPLGKLNRPVAGHVVRIADRYELPKRAKIKPILARDPAGLSLTTDLIELASWMAGYYCCPLGMVLATMIPAAVKRGTGTVTVTMVRLPEPDHEAPASLSTDHPGHPPPTPAKLKLTHAQQAVLAAAQQRLAAGKAWLPIRQLADLAGVRTVGPVKQLIDKGLLIARQQTSTHATDPAIDQPPQPPTPAAALQLTSSQRRAVDHLAAQVHRGFSVHLLLGVTGSGKTEVYLRVIAELLKNNAPPSPNPNPIPQPPQSHAKPGAIVLVPEIALTPQTVARFVGRFEGVAVLHSGLTPAQRHEQWRRIRSGEAQIVVGARSAVFAPLPRLGVIVVDEEHDASYKQDQLPRYHARDVAIKRAQILGIPVVLGSATPSLESYYNASPQLHAGPPTASSGHTAAPSPAPLETPDSAEPSASGAKGYHLLHLPDRVAGLKLPTVQIVDMKQERRRGVHLLSARLEEALQQTLGTAGQAILLLNRRGYANYIACPDHRCGWLMNCNYCDALMVYHKDQTLPAGGFLRCHHCRSEQLLPRLCPLCSKHVTVFGLGTQRVEEELQRKFPGARLLRMDSDTMKTRRDYEQTLGAFGRGELDVLVGTQMIAKGLDFPNVRLVGVISADTSLHLPDFRASERAFQLVAQVAGRAGRGDRGGLVIVQTFNPNDPAIILASRHDYEGFARREIALRRQVGLPPCTRMARVVVRDRDFTRCQQQARQLTDQMAKFNARLALKVQLRGPMPCPVARINEYHRWQVELVAAQAGSIQRLFTALRNARLLLSDARTAVDVDPVMLL